MKKYGGQLIHAQRDEYGPIEVLEFNDRMRSLHFGNATQQTGMFLFNPVILIHKYTQAMLTPLCWKVPDQPPGKVLALGLGAAAIPKYLLHFFPNIEIDAVELRPAVAEIAIDYFSLPPNDPRLQIHFASAEQYLASCDSPDASYDLILVDLFITCNETDINVDISPYFKKLHQLLQPDGDLCINLIGTQHQKYVGFNRLVEDFSYHVYTMPVDTSNIILLARHQSLPLDGEQIDFTTLEKQFGLPFRQYFNKLKIV